MSKSVDFRVACCQCCLRWSNGFVEYKTEPRCPVNPPSHSVLLSSLNGRKCNSKLLPFFQPMIFYLSGTNHLVNRRNKDKSIFVKNPLFFFGCSNESSSKDGTYIEPTKEELCQLAFTSMDGLALYPYSILEQSLDWGQEQEFWEASQVEKSLAAGGLRKALQGALHTFPKPEKPCFLPDMSYSISQRFSACRRSFFHINANSRLPFSAKCLFLVSGQVVRNFTLFVQGAFLVWTKLRLGWVYLGQRRFT